MTSESLPEAFPIKTIHSSDSDESNDDSPVLVCPVRRRMPTCLAASEIDENAIGNNLYTNKFLNYRKLRLQFIESPDEELVAKSNCDVDEEEDIFTKNTKSRPHRKKVLAVEKHLEDTINSVASLPTDAVQARDIVEICSEVPQIVRQVSKQTASILKEFEEATSILCDPKVTSLSGETNTLDLSDDCLCLDDVQTSREVSVKVRWRSSIKRFQMQSNEPFSNILPQLAKETDATLSDILLALKDTTVKHSDTPESINLRVVDIIDCYVIKMIADTVEDDAVIELKLQSENRWKKVVKIHKESPMKTLMEECAAEKGIPASKVIFKFDGEVIEPGETPADLDLESGLCIDVTFVS